MQNIGIFQLVDSSFPIGGFVYSMGMESAIKSQLLKNEADLKAYLVTYLEQLISFELPFLVGAYHSKNDEDKIKDITITYKAMLMNPKLEKSSLMLGKNLVKLLISIYNEEIAVLQNSLHTTKIAKHYTIVLGMAMKLLNVSEKQMKEMFIFTALRDQVTALTRLGTIGPLGAQGLLTYLLKVSESKLKEQKIAAYFEAKKSAYIIEIVQLNHDSIYSKLFQN